MSLATFFGISAGIQLLFLGLDLADRHATRAQRYGGESLRLASLLFLLAAVLFHVQGFVDYAWHRWFSHHRLFWFTHESHHLPSEIFVGMPGLGVRHSSFMRRGWLAHRLLHPLALTSPQEHVLHHTVDLRGNFGNFTTLWDRLFGTYLDPRRPEHQDRRYGLAYDRDFLGAISVGTMRIPAAWRRRFQVGRYCNIDEPDGGRSDGTR